MIRIILIWVFTSILSPLVSYGQNGIARSFESFQQLWLSADVERKLSDKLRIGADFPYRRQSMEKENIRLYEHLHRYGVRLWTSLDITDEIDISISPFAYFYDIPPANDLDKKGEWNDEIRFTLRFRYTPEKSRLGHRYTIEQRNRRNYDSERWRELRLRYRLRFTQPISNGYYFIAEEEVLINTGNDIAYNIFDSNRVFVGLRREVGKGANLTGGYLNVIEQQSSGERFFIIHALNLSISLNSSLLQ